MDNLRKVSEIIFCNRRCEDILSYWHSPKRCLLEDILDEQWFCSVFRERYNIFTESQIEVLYKILLTEWVKGGDDFHGKKESLFYVLTHFSEKTIFIKNEEPLCKYPELLRWHSLAFLLGEDTLTTPFLAKQDLKCCRVRDKYCWSPFLRTDNCTLNDVIDRGMADLHYHLNGSTAIFEANWISLMNNVEHRGCLFGDMKRYLRPDFQLSYNDNRRSLYWSSMVAAAIRVYLYGKICGKFEKTDLIDLKRIANSQEKEIELYLPSIQQAVTLCRFAVSDEGFGERQLDYALCQSVDIYDIYDTNERDWSVNGFFSGERFILYNAFKKIFSSNDNDLEILLYAYLAAKERLRQEFVLLNKKGGFMNFKDYQDRKENFLSEKEKKAAIGIAIKTSFFDQKCSYIEARISPKNSVREMVRNVKGKKDIADKALNEVSDENKRADKKLFFITHYIKRTDKQDTEKIRNLGLVVNERNHDLREMIKKQTLVLECYKNEWPISSYYLVGVDAANTEIGCRPEVFGQAYRYLRQQNAGFRHPLGFTYHVGEDFLDVVDGMRAVEEAMMFLNLSNGDRVGHALVLGVDVKKYYEMENMCPVMPKIILLDNVVWLWKKIQEFGLNEFRSQLSKLEDCFDRYFREVYVEYDGFSMNAYYNSWLLRGDNPSYYISNPGKEMQNGFAYDSCALNMDPEIVIARKDRVARGLYNMYHFDKNVRINGQNSTEFKIDEYLVSAIVRVQEVFRSNFQRRGIAIESNPSSNLLIGTYKKYSDLPLVKMNNYGLNLKDVADCQIPISINTDDQGVFYTSLSREFALMALGIEKDNSQGNVPLDVYRWIDMVRNMGFVQRFHKGPGTRQISQDHIPSDAGSE